MARDVVDVQEVLEDYGEFWGWLQLHLDEVVGMSVLGEACPIAVWLDEALGGSWVVTPSRCGDRAGWHSASLPAWARLFVERVDGWCAWCGLLTGEVALAVLAQVIQTGGVLSSCEVVRDG